MSIGKISRRPKSIINESTIFEKYEKPAQVR